MAQACDVSLKRQAERLKTAGGDPKAELQACFTRYLSTKNRDVPEHACLFPSLAAEVARQPEAVRSVFSEGVGAYLDSPGVFSDAGRGRKNAVHILSTLVGAMVLARAVGDAALSAETLTSARASLSAQFG